MRTLLITLMAIGCGKDSGGIIPGGGGGTPNTLPDDPPPGSGSDTGGTPIDTGDSGSSSDDTADTSPPEDTADTSPPEDSGDTGFTIEGTGWTSGEVAYNLTAMEATGAPFSLHDLYGRKVVVMAGHLDVATTTDTLVNMNTTAEEHSDVTFLAFIGRGADGAHCDMDCAAAVSSTYGTPRVQVLFEASSTLTTHSEWIRLENTRTYVINSSMEIDWTTTGTVIAGQLDNKLDDLSR